MWKRGGAQIRLQTDDLNRESSVGVRRERRGRRPCTGEQWRRHTNQQGRRRCSTRPGAIASERGERRRRAGEPTGGELTSGQAGSSCSDKSSRAAEAQAQTQQSSRGGVHSDGRRSTRSDTTVETRRGGGDSSARQLRRLRPSLPPSLCKRPPALPPSHPPTCAPPLPALHLVQSSPAGPPSLSSGHPPPALPPPALPPSVSVSLSSPPPALPPSGPPSRPVTPLRPSLPLIRSSPTCAPPSGPPSSVSVSLSSPPPALPPSGPPSLCLSVSLSSPMQDSSRRRPASLSFRRCHVDSRTCRAVLRILSHCAELETCAPLSPPRSSSLLPGPDGAAALGGSPGEDGCGLGKGRNGDGREGCGKAADRDAPVDGIQSHGKGNSCKFSHDIIPDTKSTDIKVQQKRKRASLTENRKEKKKLAKKRKRAETNRKLGVKRLKLEMISKPKKVIPCSFYQKGRCQKGDSCKFSHDIIPDTKSTPCSFFARGICLKGDDCPFDHQLSKYPCHTYMSEGRCSRGDSCLFSHKISAGEPSSSMSVSRQTDSKMLSGNKNLESSLSTSVVNTSLNTTTSRNISMPKDSVKQMKKQPPRMPKGICFLSFGKETTISINKQADDLDLKECDSIQVQRQEKIMPGTLQNANENLLISPVEKLSRGTSTSMVNEVNSLSLLLNPPLLVQQNVEIKSCGSAQSHVSNTSASNGSKDSVNSESRVIDASRILEEFLFTRID